MEAKDVYVSVGGSNDSGASGDSPAAPVSLSRFLTIFKTHTRAIDPVFNAYFRPGTYTFTETLTLTNIINPVEGGPDLPDQAGVLFVFDKEPGTTDDVLFVPNGTNVGVFESSPQVAGKGGCNITFRNIIFNGFRGKENPLSPGNAYGEDVDARNRVGRRVFTVRHNSTVLTLDHVTIQNCDGRSDAAGQYDDLIGMAHSAIYVSASQTNFHVFISEINIYNSSIIDNDRSSADVCCIRNGNSRIYNTTFSNNTAAYVASAEFLSSFTVTATPPSNLSRGYIAFVNNTVRNSGNARINLIARHMSYYAHGTQDNAFPGSAFFANNIFTGSSEIAAGQSIENYCISNIVGTNYIASGRTGGTAISNFNNYFSSSVTTTADAYGSTAGRSYHPILTLNQTSHPIIGQVDNLDDIGSKVWDTEGFTHLSYDQLRQVRAKSRSIGAIDVNGFQVQNGDVRVYYDSSEPAPDNEPQNTLIDLSQYVLNNPITGTTSYALAGSGALADCGTVSISGGNATFQPVLPIPNDGYKEGSFTFRVSGTDPNGRPHEETATVRIQVLDLKLDEVALGSLPGYDGALGVQCKIDMKPVDFDPRYKFITGAFNNNTIGGSSYDNVTVSNTDHLGQVYDYHVPLVGDLNGDGRPEIVALGMSGNNAISGFDVTINAIHIFNGQDGTLLKTQAIPAFKPYGVQTAANSGYDGYHGSPGCMALIDSDGDGNVEIILATGSTPAAADVNKSKKLLSYVINKTNWNITPNTNWHANGVSYGKDNSTTDANFSSPIIQIVDFDGDGVAEVLAYNKIFDTRDGTLLLEYETLELDPETAGAAYVGRDFKGRETWHQSHTGNSKIGFASVYDIDKDGKYEICAGGKVYYDIDFSQTNNADRYKVLDIMEKLIPTEKAWLSGTPPALPISSTNSRADEIRKFTDARTAVADIDGDGIPEIVASYYVQSNFNFDTKTNTDGTHAHGSENKLRIVAWNATLNKSNPAASTGTLKAILTIPLSNHATTGTYSYMYIADVDGREQNGQKLPEISMLGPMFYCYMYGSAWTGYPIHPNVADKMAASYPRTGGPTDAIRAKGSLISFTWDNTPNLSVFDRLKVSFMMEHDDESVNTGFSLFDFDNDGINEICYRDMATLRIIRPTIPFVPLNDNSVTIFTKPVKSNTGFEYPVIVDLDGDYSGDMLVSGSDATPDPSTTTYLYAVQGANVDLAPARTVWNQFMYSPLKINDDLTIPQPPVPHPLSPAAAFFKDAGDTYETPIYNMNIGQVPYFSLAEGTGLFAPLVKTPDAVISDLKFVLSALSTDVDTIQFIITNEGEAAVNVNTPIKIYEGESASNPAYKDTIVGSAVYPGDTVIMKIPLKAPDDESKTFLIRVSDDSFDNGNPDVFTDPENLSSFADCDWDTNWDVLSDFYLRADYYTVLPNETVVLDILANDKLGYFLPDVKTVSDFTVVHAAGSTEGKMDVVNQKLQFTAPATGGLICYTYKSKDVPSLPPIGYIYIYVAELETPNTLLCEGTSYELKVKELPTGGVTFDYYDSNGTEITGNPSFTASMSAPVQTFSVKPLSLIASVPANTALGTNFPLKRIDFKVVPTTDVLRATMRWTGLKNTDWHNPDNWVEVAANGNTSVVTYFPSACVDVVIPAGAPNYPELAAEAWCTNIKMGDRAMIAGIHLLHYETAEVEFKLNADERDRFVMWSAPLKDMYSGDYHFKDGGGIPKFGDVYMNMFQQAKPDGSAPAAANTFTATFGNLGVLLSKGKAFNLNVTSTAANAGKSFIFPQTTITSYTDVNGTPYNLPSRTNARKFIIDMNDSQTPGSAYATLPVVNDVAGNTLVQVVNPYMAYLEVYQFINNNSTAISDAGYAIWDGNTSGFSQVGVIGSPDNRYQITTAPTMTPSGFIPPLQSFFVQKKTTGLLGAVTINATWAFTNQANPYKLRAGAPETNVLRIKAVQDGKSVSYAVLHYNESTSPAYNSSEDMHKLFYQLEEDVIPLEVYTFAPTREVLAINSSSDFSQHTPLGLRTGKAGSVTLEFSGMATFGHDVYLIDHAQGDKETNLQNNPAYTFTVTKKSSGDKVIELNDRFSLRTTYTGIGLGNDVISSTTGLSVSSRDGYIYVQTASPANSLQIYSATGALVYNSAVKSDYFRIQTDRQQAYIVKIKIGNEYLTQKVFVK